MLRQTFEFQHDIRSSGVARANLLDDFAAVLLAWRE
jgi:hypothetical protein